MEEEHRRPLILISNDDGINSPGLFALASLLRTIGEVIVVAPDREQSAVGHSLTMNTPLRVTPFRRNGEVFGFAVNGTPADCVKIALTALLKRTPDIVISGINHGQNTAINILYSGTVSASTEGMLFGIKSIAFSVCSHNWDLDMSSSAYYAALITKKALSMEFPKDTFLNVNIPAIPQSEIKGIKLTNVGNGYWKDFYDKRRDPFNREYYWFSGEYYESVNDIANDDIAVREKFVSITPIKYSLTNKAAFDFFNSFEQE